MFACRNAVPEQSDRLLERILQETTEAPSITVTDPVASKNEEIVEDRNTSTKLVKEPNVEESCHSTGDEEGDKSMEISRDSSAFDDSSKGFSGDISDATPSESESEGKGHYVSCTVFIDDDVVFVVIIDSFAVNDNINIISNINIIFINLINFIIITNCHW